MEETMRPVRVYLMAFVAAYVLFAPAAAFADWCLVDIGDMMKSRGGWQSFACAGGNCSVNMQACCYYREYEWEECSVGFVGWMPWFEFLLDGVCTSYTGLACPCTSFNQSYGGEDYQVWKTYCE